MLKSLSVLAALAVVTSSAVSAADSSIKVCPEGITFTECQNFF